MYATTTDVHRILASPYGVMDTSMYIAGCTQNTVDALQQYTRAAVR